MECDTFPFSALTTLFGQQEGRIARKQLGVDLLMVTLSLELCTSYSSSDHHHVHHL